MSLDPIANALIHIKNSDMASKKKCIVRPSSKLLKEILRVLKENEFIDKYSLIEDGRDNMLLIDLAGKINDCKAIKPRYAVKKDEYEKFEKRYLPAQDIGILIISTSQGVKTHREAKQAAIGGRLVAYVY